MLDSPIKKHIQDNVFYNKSISDDFDKNTDSKLVFTLFPQKKPNSLSSDIILSLLKELGFNLCQKGSIYLKDVIYYLIQEQKNEDFSLKYVYLLLSRERNITVEKIKCDIENAVRNASFSYSTLYKFFKYYDGRKKITTKYLIFLIINSNFSNQFQE